MGSLFIRLLHQSCPAITLSKFLSLFGATKSSTTLCPVALISVNFVFYPERSAKTLGGEGRVVEKHPLHPDTGWDCATNKSLKFYPCIRRPKYVAKICLRSGPNRGGEGRGEREKKKDWSPLFSQYFSRPLPLPPPPRDIALYDSNFEIIPLFYAPF